MTRTARRLQSARSLLATALMAFTLMVGGGTAIAMPAAADAPASDEEAAAFEVDFLTDMIDHHQMAVMMAETCIDKALHDDLAQLCESIRVSQSQEIDQMQTWLEDWYGITYEPQMSEGAMQRMQRLSSLSGEEYEIRFMRSMIRHHWTAVREAETCLDEAEHQDLLDLCSSIREVQLDEIEQMQTWLVQWYDKQGGRPAQSG